MTKLDEKIKLIISHWCTDPYPTTEAHVDVAVRMVMDEIKSLNAITELAVKEIELLKQSKADVEHNRKLLSKELQLAVKGLKDAELNYMGRASYESPDNTIQEMLKPIRSTLSEIERLSHE